MERGWDESSSCEQLFSRSGGPAARDRAHLGGSARPLQGMVPRRPRLRGRAEPPGAFASYRAGLTGALRNACLARTDNRLGQSLHPPVCEKTPPSGRSGSGPVFGVAPATRSAPGSSQGRRNSTSGSPNGFGIPGGWIRTERSLPCRSHRGVRRRRVGGHRPLRHQGGGVHLLAGGPFAWQRGLGAASTDLPAPPSLARHTAARAGVELFGSSGQTRAELYIDAPGS